MAGLDELLTEIGYKKTTSLFLTKTLEMRKEVIKNLLSSKNENEIINALGNFSSIMAKALISLCLDPVVETDSKDDGTDISDQEVIAAVVTPIIFEVCLMTLMMADGDEELTRKTITYLVDSCLNEGSTVLKDLNKIQGIDEENGKRKTTAYN